jgi:hypothetical protein
MDSSRTGPGWRSIAGALLLGAALLALGDPVMAQDEAALDAAATDEGAYLLTDDELRIIVAPIAFYPDDILALVLPASTTGIQIVQAQRFLEARKTDETLQPDENWDPSIQGLINYPDIVDLMNADLNWTDRLATAVLDQLDDVMSMIQQVRAEAVAAGYLKTDEHQTIVQEGDTVVIESADPEVVYVPQYDPVVVVEQSYVSYPPYAYYPPYPYYYSPAATFFAGAFVGAAFAYGFDWHNDDIDINIDNSRINNIDASKFNGDRVREGDRDKVSWKGDKQRSKRERGAQNRRDQAAGVAPASDRRKDGAGQGSAGEKRERAGERASTGRDKGAFGDVGTGRETKKASNRGKQQMNKSGGTRQKGTQQRSASTRTSGGGQSAFSGSSHGKQASRQKSRGQRSSGGGGRRRR